MTAKRTAALDAAIANHGGDHRLVKLGIVGAQAYAEFREALTAARDQHGPKASLTEIAAVYSTMFGRNLTKDQCRNRRDVVARLETQGKAWYRWRDLWRPVELVYSRSRKHNGINESEIRSKIK